MNAAVLAGNCNRWMSQHRAVSLAQRAVSLGTVTDAGQNRCVQNNAAFAHNLPTLHMSVVYLFYSRTGILPDVCLDAEYPNTLRAIASAAD